MVQVTRVFGSLALALSIAGLILLPVSADLSDLGSGEFPCGALLSSHSDLEHTASALIADRCDEAKSQRWVAVMLCLTLFVLVVVGRVVWLRRRISPESPLPVGSRLVVVVAFIVNNLAVTLILWILARRWRPAAASAIGRLFDLQVLLMAVLLFGVGVLLLLGKTDIIVSGWWAAALFASIALALYIATFVGALAGRAPQWRPLLLDPWMSRTSTGS